MYLELELPFISSFRGRVNIVGSVPHHITLESSAVIRSRPGGSLILLRQPVPPTTNIHLQLQLDRPQPYALLLCSPSNIERDVPFQQPLSASLCLYSHFVVCTWPGPWSPPFDRLCRSNIIYFRLLLQCHSILRLTLAPMVPCLQSRCRSSSTSSRRYPRHRTTTWTYLPLHFTLEPDPHARVHGSWIMVQALLAFVRTLKTSAGPVNAHSFPFLLWDTFGTRPSSPSTCYYSQLQIRRL